MEHGLEKRGKTQVLKGCQDMVNENEIKVEKIDL